MKPAMMSETSKIEILASVTRLLDSQSDIDEVLGRIMETAVTTLDVKASSLMMVKDRKLRFFMASGETKKQLQDLEVGMGEGIAGWVATNNTPLLVQDVENDYRWSSKVSEITGFKVKSIACCPLRVQKEVVGVIEILDRRSGKPLSEEDLTKLISFSELAETIIANTTRIKSMSAENEYLKKEIDSRYRLVGESPMFRKVLADADRLAKTNATCIIMGESGTGKELVARHIFRNSERAQGPFVATNCGALPESILERELFGHEKGAFTGADRRQIGLFEAADGGTIFLDEISEMAVSMQVKLLRILQEKNFYRLGGTVPINVDARVIAATNRDLSQMVREGKFREDLYYRLNVIKLELPPLRERREDIEPLVKYFLQKQDIVPLSRNIKIGGETLEYLKNYSWPGNVRELENAIERALVLREGDELTVKDFPPQSPSGPEKTRVGMPLKAAVEDFKRDFIRKTLAHSHGKRTEAARILEIERTYLSKLIKELHLT